MRKMRADPMLVGARAVVVVQMPAVARAVVVAQVEPILVVEEAMLEVQTLVGEWVMMGDLTSYLRVPTHPAHPTTLRRCPARLQAVIRTPTKQPFRGILQPGPITTCSISKTIRTAT